MDNTISTTEGHTASNNGNNAPSSLFSETSLSSSSHDDIDAITPLEESNSAFGNLDLVKTSTLGSIISGSKTSSPTATDVLLQTTPASRQKAREVQRENNNRGAAEAQAVMFCF